MVSNAQLESLAAFDASKNINAPMFVQICFAPKDVDIFVLLRPSSAPKSQQVPFWNVFVNRHVLESEFSLPKVTAFDLTNFRKR